ncbi:replication protein A 70 kDa DNA-binding subunit C [Trifolium repens]|nr:replication protein A 70 kDa DNA-binding subunit C [Trifolium repens]
MVFNEKCSAGSKFNDIADKLPGREDVCIDVRILRLWKLPAFLNPTEASSIEMVLVDKKVENGADEVIRGVNDADECFCYDAFVYFVVEIQAPLHPF